MPSILTAAGTSDRFRDRLRSAELYEFIGAGAAFVLLGVVAIATLAATLLHGPALALLDLSVRKSCRLMVCRATSRITGRSTSILPSLPRPAACCWRAYG